MIVAGIYLGPFRKIREGHIITPVTCLGTSVKEKKWYNTWYFSGNILEKDQKYYLKWAMNKWRFIDAWPVILLEFLTFLDLFFERNSCSYDHGITLSGRSSLRIAWNAESKDKHFGGRFWSWVGAIFPLFLLCLMLHKEGVVYVNVDAQRGGGICKRWQKHDVELGMKEKVILLGRFL